MAKQKTLKKTSTKRKSLATDRVKKSPSRRSLIASRHRFEQAKRRSHLEVENSSVDLQLLVAGVAHEFNNVLGAADGHAQWALASGKLKDMREALEIIRLACKKSFGITQALSVFTQPKEEEKIAFKSSSLKTELETFFSSSFKHQKIQFELSFEEAMLFGNINEIFEVLMNLIKNAVESFDAVPIEKPRIVVNGKLKTPNYIITVTDNGSPIPSVYQKHIFQPFFSSKGVLSHTLQPHAGSSTGTRENHGLGLFLSRKIAEEHGGSLILIETQKLKTFQLQLPHATL